MCGWHVVAMQGKKLGEMSKGMKRKVAIARSLINNPEVLIYDEPSSGLDPLTSHFIAEYVKGLKGRKTVLLSTHNLYQAEELCDRILIIREGEEVIRGTVSELKAHFGKPEYTLHFTCEGGFQARGVEILREDGCYTAQSSSLEGINRLAKSVLEGGGRILGVRSSESSIEDVFLKALEECSHC